MEHLFEDDDNFDDFFMDEAVVVGGGGEESIQGSEIVSNNNNNNKHFIINNNNNNSSSRRLSLESSSSTSLKANKNNNNNNKPFTLTNNNNTQPKVRLPQSFHKGKRTLNKIIHTYFNDLKLEYEKFHQTQKGCHIYIHSHEIESIINSIKNYVGIRHQERHFLEIDFKKLSEMRKKLNAEYRTGSFCYMSETKSILNYNKKGNLTEISIDTLKSDIQLPAMATPVPFRESIYLLDGINFSKQLNGFVPDEYSYKVNQKGHITRLEQQPFNQRMKCAIVRDENAIYLFGGKITKHKIATNSCERYYPCQGGDGRYEPLKNMNYRHHSPSACIMGEKIWVFSQTGIEYLFKDIWTTVRMPFGMRCYSFQFCTAINESEVLIMGGVDQNEKKVSRIQIYNTEKNYSDDFHEILPQGISSERVWSPCPVDNSLVVVSGMQAEIYPDIGSKKNVVQIINLTSNGIYIQSIYTAK